MTRLIFTKNQSGTIHTTKEVLAREKVINAHVMITDTGVKYIVTDLGSGQLLANGGAKNITEAKKIIKAKFKDLGVLFHDEVRKKLE